MGRGSVVQLVAALAGIVAFIAGFLAVWTVAHGTSEHPLLTATVKALLYVVLILVAQARVDYLRGVIASALIATFMAASFAALFSSRPDRWLEMSAVIGGSCAAAVAIALARWRLKASH